MIIYANSCPVCGLELDYLPWDQYGSSSFEICLGCGIQFGYTDAAGGDEDKRLQIYRDWRKEWIDNGMKWDSEGIIPPINWNPEKQLENIPEKFR